MAKRRKKGRRKKYRFSGARSVSGIQVMDTIGAVAGGALSKVADKFLPATMDKKLVAGAKIALGAILPMIAPKGQTGDILKGAGLGLAGVGAAQLMTELGVLNGIGAPADDDMLAVAIEGIEDVEFEDVTDSMGADVLAADVLAYDDDYMSGDDVPVINGEDVPVING